jgi:Mn-dependent DtxR family transcriptional regulator
VDEATARSDAEGLEHHLSEQTLDAMERFVAEGRGGGARSGKSRPARG